MLDEDSALQVLDPEKTGLQLFQYLTGGVTLLADGWKSIVATAREDVPAPRHFDPDWMFTLKKGEAMRRTVTLHGFKGLLPGSYEASFTFRSPPITGAKAVTAAEGRIWLGQRESRLRCQEPGILSHADAGSLSHPDAGSLSHPHPG